MIVLRSIEPLFSPLRLIRSGRLLKACDFGYYLLRGQMSVVRKNSEPLRRGELIRPLPIKGRLQLLLAKEPGKRRFGALSPFFTPRAAASSGRGAALLRTRAQRRRDVSRSIWDSFSGL